MPPGSKIKLPSDRVPSTIDKNVISEALGLHEIKDDEEDSEASREFLIKTAKTLRLEYRQILKVDNLHSLSSLTRLFLDNNFIERISGLDQLFHLTWLDLSFNRISRIEGLESLQRLEVLGLYANEIERIEHLDHLTKLKVLRLGKNRISSKDDIVYLRILPALRTLSIKENPYCEAEKDWRGFAIALLPNLLYLECHSVTEEDRDLAERKHQGDVFRARNAEEQAREVQEKREEEKASKRRHKAAFVASLRGDSFNDPSSYASSFAYNAHFFTVPKHGSELIMDAGHSKRDANALIP